MSKKNLKDTTESTSVDLTAISNGAGELAASFVQEIDKSWLEGVEIERIVPMEDGMGVRGEFLGRGGDVDVSDPVTGEVRALGTWRIRVSPKVVIRILDSARLRSDLSRLETGSHIRVMRLGVKDTKKGRRVTDYVVGIEKRGSGGTPETMTGAAQSPAGHPVNREGNA